MKISKILGIHPIYDEPVGKVSLRASKSDRSIVTVVGGTVVVGGKVVISILITVLIQSLYSNTSPYMPGFPASAQPNPQLTIPVKVKVPLLSQTRGPPESPWQASFPSSDKLSASSLSGRPAQNSSEANPKFWNA